MTDGSRPDPPERPTGARDAALAKALRQELARVAQLDAWGRLGITPDSGVTTVRRAFRRLCRSYHPDAYARHRSAHVSALALEVFLLLSDAEARLQAELRAAPPPPAQQTGRGQKPDGEDYPARVRPYGHPSTRNSPHLNLLSVPAKVEETTRPCRRFRDPGQ